MNDIVAQQVQFLLATLCFGMLTIFLYDGLRLIRWVFLHGKILIAIEDIVYWFIMAILGYLVFLKYNDGIVRWYGLVCVFVGAVLYETGISRGIRKNCDRIFSPKRRKIRVWLERKRKGKKLRKARNGIVKNG